MAPVEQVVLIVGGIKGSTRPFAFCRQAQRIVEAFDFRGSRWVLH